MQTFQSLQIYLQVQSNYIYLILCLDGHLCQMTLEQTYQTLPQHPPGDALDSLFEKETSSSRNIKKEDQESEGCQDDLDLLTAAFGDSHLCMQAQVFQPDLEKDNCFTQPRLELKNIYQKKNHLSLKPKKCLLLNNHNEIAKMGN